MVMRSVSWLSVRAVEIMHQSRASLNKDMPSVARMLQGPSSSVAIYIEVPEISNVIDRLAGLDMLSRSGLPRMARPSSASASRAGI